MSKEIALSRNGSIVPQTLSELMQFAELLSKSGMIPNAYKGRPHDIIVAVQLGAEAGLKPIQALQNISCINGKPSIYGDGAIGLVEASGLMEDFKEEIVGKEGTDTWGYKCSSKRKGKSTWTVHTFTVADAKRASLWGKEGPWSKYPQRMLQMRARSWVLRDDYANVLKGLSIVEEVMDIEPIAEPEKGTIAIEDLQPVKEISVEELRDKIYKACLYLANGDTNGAKVAYHNFADIIKPVTREDENGDKYTEFDRTEAEMLSKIPIEKAKEVWKKVEEQFEGMDVDLKDVIYV